MHTHSELLDEIRARIATGARPDMTTSIDGLLMSKVTSGPAIPEYSLTAPLLVVMAQGGKHLLLGDRTYEYRAGQYLVVTANLPVTGHWVGTSEATPALALALVLRPSAIAALLLQTSAGRRPRAAGDVSAMATGEASAELLDAVVRMLRLLDEPADAAVLAPLIEKEILWRLLTGPQGDTLRQIGLADSDLTHVSRAIGWIRDNYAEPMRVDDLAGLSGMSASAFHRNFRAVTAMSPLQFQKRIRLQQARSLLLAHPRDVAGIGHVVGYDSPSQFTREYRRLFGAPPGQDAARLRTEPEPVASFI
ncbi:AraC family transcriptional regulator [Mycobacterium sp. AZCC_0083]|uniref:AraC family transcriptional regulator n=1 Tax=Mycobacterium sp. AZCC_0083 TaxID=2735882 RepID=UPI00160DB6AE|nr:AraC family transcriptional regulator [Mycobacterium sp. AZCC_0083]MBB5162803.1 AraC-like DNA-binding protein [Mycobacterium sp. AZCC_0083]